jgi:DNA-directed RNA polymerase subunit RPC12/RpoP
MALTIHCTMCGANVVPKDLEIRREIAVCSHCSTLLRITRSGTEAYRDALQTVATPAGVQVRRPKPGSLSITAPRTEHALAINRPELVQGTWIGVAISLGITAAAGLLSIPLVLLFGRDLIGIIAVSLVLIFIPTLFISVCASIVILAVAHKTLPPLWMENGVIHPSVIAVAGPSTPGKHAIETKAIRQLYSTATKVVTGSTTQNYENYMVYALMQDERRIALIGPLDRPETALYIEELFETDLGILDLPVYGDEKIPAAEGRSAPVSPQAAEGKGLRCDGCGAELTAGPDDQRRGYVTCRYCGGLTLLYEPGSTKPILGIPSADRIDSQYAVATVAGETTVTARGSADPQLRISGGRIELTRMNGSHQTIPASQIVGLLIKDAEWIRQKGSTGAAVAAGLLSIGKAMAYSGEVDPGKILRDSIISNNFALFAKTAGGEDIPLLAGIRNLPEAYFLLTALREAGRLP